MAIEFEIHEPAILTRFSFNEAECYDSIYQNHTL